MIMIIAMMTLRSHVCSSLTLLSSNHLIHVGKSLSIISQSLVAEPCDAVFVGQQVSRNMLPPAELSRHPQVEPAICDVVCILRGGGT